MHTPVSLRLYGSVFGEKIFHDEAISLPECR